MHTDAAAALVSRHLPRDHPLVTRDYSLFTPAIGQMAEQMGGWLDDQVDGATIYGPSRYGKSSAVDHWLQSLRMHRHKGFVPMVVWSHADSGGAQSVGRFYAQLLLASRHPLATATRSPFARQHMLIERWAELAHQGGGRFIVLVIDEAQGTTQREWLWLVQLHSLLEKERLRLCVFSIASLQFFDEPMAMAQTGGAHVAARFMLTAQPFHGVRDVEELAFVLAGYDQGTEWPAGSGVSFTAGIAPQPWADGFRMANLAPALMQALRDDLPERYAGPVEFPMKTVVQAARHVLLRVAAGALPDDVMSARSLASIVAASGHRALMAIVTALGARSQRARPA
ncbi:AAA family ATPase [Variovorax sp. RT4R15]|uniref:AAA family ATPase n=1 Tax=Variovorax sp. RT4R15 TaxID=3443737 RepID=UPI003F48F549